MISSSDLVSPPPNWDSNQALSSWYPRGRRSPRCWCWSRWLAAGSNLKKREKLRSRRSSCPSRFSRPRLWSRHGRMCSCHRPKQQIWWTPASISSQSPLVSSLSSQRQEGSSWGSLARWQHLWVTVYQFDFKKRINFFYIVSPPLTLAATAFCWAKHRVFWLPESWSTGRVRSTGHVHVTLATATVASESINVVLVGAVQGSREIAGLPRSGTNCDRAKRPWGEGKSLLNSQRWQTGRICWKLSIWKFVMHSVPPETGYFAHRCHRKGKKGAAIGRKLSQRDPGILERHQICWAEMDLGELPMGIWEFHFLFIIPLEKKCLTEFFYSLLIVLTETWFCDA